MTMSYTFQARGAFHNYTILLHLIKILIEKYIIVHRKFKYLYKRINDTLTIIASFAATPYCYHM